VQRLKQWHIAIAAEAFTAGLFARLGYDVSVQYGADQPEYDLIVSKGDSILKVSVIRKSRWKLGLNTVVQKEQHISRRSQNLAGKTCKVYCHLFSSIYECSTY